MNHTPPTLQRSLAVAILMALAFVPSGCRLQAASLVSAPPEAWASRDAMIVADMPDIARTRDRWPQTAAAQAWGDPATAYWRSTQLVAGIEDALSRFGLGDLGAWIDLAERRATVVVEARPGGGTMAIARIALVARIDFGSQADSARAMSKRRWPRKTARLVRLGGKDLEIVVHGGQPGGFAPSSAWFGSVCWIASSEQALEEALKRAAGDDEGLAPSLSRSDVWRKARGERREADDVFVFANATQAREVLADAAGALARLTGRPEADARIRNTMRWVGMDDLDCATVNLELRGKGIYERSALRTKRDPKGLMFITDGSAPLVTPRWMTADVESYSTVRVKSLDAWKTSAMQMLESLYPEARERLRTVGAQAQAFVGFDPDLALRAFGSEFATVSRPASPIPDVAFLMQIRDRKAMEGLLESVRARQTAPPGRKTYKGYHIETYVVGAVGFYVYVAEVHDFLMVSTGEGWLRSYIDTSHALKASGKTVERNYPMGPNSLLPALDAPFGETGRMAKVVARSYSNPGPGYTQLNGSLPMILPFANMLLQQQGLPRVPEWVQGTIPPLMPFAMHAFPTVERVSQTPERVVTERYSAYEPLADPIAAAGIAIGLRMGLERLERIERSMPR